MPLDWVDIGNCNWLHEAQLMKSVLEAAGIEAVVPDEHTLGVQPAYSALGVRVQVRQADAGRARDVLESFAATPASLDSDGDSD